MIFIVSQKNLINIILQKKFHTLNKDIFIYCQKEDINKLFTYGKGYENRYNMYFAIPVYINDEIQGLFQITYFSESTLFNEKENIDFLINKIFPQYISITLLINEIYNSFRTMDTSD